MNNDNWLKIGAVALVTVIVAAPIADAYRWHPGPEGITFADTANEAGLTFAFGVGLTQSTAINWRSS